MKAWRLALAGLCWAGGAWAAEPPGYDKWLEVPVAERCARMFADLGQPSRQLHLPSATVRFVDLEPAEPVPGPPWLLIHGYGGSLCSYGPMMAELRQRHRVLAFDLPGFGESASTDEHYTIDSYVETLRQFLDRIGAGPVHLVCHSLGGHVCIGAALTESRYIATMTLIDTAGAFNTAAFIKQVAKQKGGVNLGRMALRRGRSLVDWTDGEQAFLRRFVVNDPAIWSAVASFRANYYEKIGGIRTPTLIVWGMDDALFPVEGAAHLKENVPNSELHILDGAGHCPNESHPRVVLELIEGFLARRGQAQP